MNKVVIFMIVMLVSVGANASTVLVLKDHTKATAVISNREQNRIHITSDRIENVFGSEEMFVHQSDVKLGQIFLRPKTKSEAFTITLTTEKNKTIDLYLVPDDRDSETIIVKIEDKKLTNPIQPIKNKDIETLIEAAIKERPIKGYKSEDVKDLKENLDQRALTKEKIYRNSNHIITVYSYKNLKPTEIILKEEMFLLSNNVIAVGIDKKRLFKNEITKIAVIEDGKENK